MRKYWLLLILFLLLCSVSLMILQTDLKIYSLINGETAIPIANLLLTFALVLVTLIYTMFTGYMVYSEFGPKLYLDAEISDADYMWNKDIMSDFGCDLVRGRGLLPECGNKKWVLKIFNNGKGPATKIKIVYEIVAYKNEITLEIDEADVKEFKPVVYQKATKEIKIDYLPPDSSKSFTIFFMGTFPEAKLEIKLLKCKEKNFITNKITISEYLYPEFELIEDSNHLRRLLSMHYK